MSPEGLLLLVVAITALAAGAAHVRWRRQRSALRRLAAEHGLHYSSGDRFQLAGKVAEQFPTPGVAAVHISHLIYGLRGDRYHYVFFADFTQGVVRTKKRLRRVVAMSEPREKSSAGRGELRVAPEELPWIEQYRVLCEPLSAKPAES